MAKLMLVNPRRRTRRKSATHRRRRTSVTVRTNPRKRRRHMTAKQAQYFGKRRRRRVSHNPIATNPRRHRRRHLRRVRRNPVVRAARRSADISLNTITSGAVIESLVVPAAIGAVGAVALDALYAALPIPADMKTGQFAAPIKAIATLGLGAVASQLLPRQRGVIESAVATSLTIAFYNFAKSQAHVMFPALDLGEYVDGIGYTGAAQFLPDYGNTPALLNPPGVGEYVSGAPGAYTSAWHEPIYGDEVF